MQAPFSCCKQLNHHFHHHHFHHHHFHLVSLAMQAPFSSNKQTIIFITIIFILFRWPCRHPFQATNKPSFSSPSFSSCFVGHAGTLFKQQTNHHFHHHHFHLVLLAMQAPFSSNKQTIIFILFCWPGLVVVIKRVLCMCVLFFLAMVLQ